MRNIFFLGAIFLLNSAVLYGQFPPAAGEEGSTAIPDTSQLFKNWAVDIEVERGWKHIGIPDSGRVDAGEPLQGTGLADKLTVSLGDGGRATLSFENPIFNGPGWDFAVFENGFPALGAYFLELAFVEVSSDGVHFVRFPATSLTAVEEQVGAFEVLDPTQLNNLAGKYVAGYGTPFDLEELRDSTGINLDQISHVRVVDVIGSIDTTLGTLDIQGLPINDPWPTAFPSGGFDLDAIGVIHEQDLTASVETTAAANFKIYPNPAVAGEILWINLEEEGSKQLSLINSKGQIVKEANFFTKKFQWILPKLVAGLYILKLNHAEDVYLSKLIIR